MKLQAERPQGRNAITSYGPGVVTINGEAHHASLLVAHDRAPIAWPVPTIDELKSEHLHGLETNADVVLLGTGARQRFPSPDVLRPLIDKRIGVEVMDTAAACRTYNVLLAEGRAVAAALIIE